MESLDRNSRVWTSGAALELLFRKRPLNNPVATYLQVRGQLRTQDSLRRIRAPPVSDRQKDLVSGHLQRSTNDRSKLFVPAGRDEKTPTTHAYRIASRFRTSILTRTTTHTNVRRA